MSPLVLAGVGLAGGAGACARFLVDRAVTRRAGLAFPVGTLTVNLVGALTLGLLAGLTVGGDVYRLAATGVLGAFTTFSTWMFETRRLGQAGRRRAAWGNLALALAFGLLAVWLGRELGAAL